jgi:hypothetical protein
MNTFDNNPEEQRRRNMVLASQRRLPRVRERAYAEALFYIAAPLIVLAICAWFL